MKELIEASIRHAQKRREFHLRYQVDLLLARCRSPIEQQLGVALFGTDPATLCFVGVCDMVDERPDANHGFYILPQMHVRSYRADFGLIFKHGYGEARLVVECDGHDFHEKTKEQAAHDKERDRISLIDGWPVMRFTGSEIYKDPARCADQAGDYLMERMLADHKAMAEAPA